MKNAIALAALVVLAAPAAAQKAPPPSSPSHFSFKVPDGWTDKSGEGRAYFTLAVDEKNRLAMQAKVQPGAEPVTPEFLEKYVTKAQESVARIAEGAELKVVDKRAVTLGGVPAARFVFEMPAPPQAADPTPTRQLQYVVPVADQHAVVTFTAPAKSYDKFQALFDKTANATVIRK